MQHLSPDRFRELRTVPLTPEEEDHTNRCDYCCEGSLLEDDPDEYDAKVYAKQGRVFTPRRPAT